MINKMPGEYEDKFKNLKCGYLFMFGHAGKKLLFMGQDFAQFHEWNEDVALDWYLTEEPLNGDLQNFVRDLLHMYRKYPAMYQLDDSWDGFEWVNADDSDRSIFSFIRKDRSGKNALLFVINMTPVAYPAYKVGVPAKGRYNLILDEQGATSWTDGKNTAKTGAKAAVKTTARTTGKKTTYIAKTGECDGHHHCIEYPLPGYGCAVFKFNL
jgi:1,4-alpha-glucan branching enzyme